MFEDLAKRLSKIADEQQELKDSREYICSLSSNDISTIRTAAMVLSYQ